MISAALLKFIFLQTEKHFCVNELICICFCLQVITHNISNKNSMHLIAFALDSTSVEPDRWEILYNKHYKIFDPDLITIKNRIEMENHALPKNRPPNNSWDYQQRHLSHSET